ncbi:hypothetical protein GCM10008015_29110 [Flavobacterium palustre]|jgi:hypothetical protein|uniref:Uncharacterized protein n=1 Tax=Flavobacterium palustre TaxID=1476463 RepID=A0ABQ1HQX9_9FLAO|nr:hypothetical protein [Flavobacterium palustre]GGA86616.1 hypothetical protein GCM10008015_29110 [Flavobacterium palustre]
MTKLKCFYVSLFFLLLGIQQSYSQVYRFKTSGFSVLEKNEKGKWGKWSDLSLVNIVVTLDTDKNRFLIYSQNIQLYEILTYQPESESESDLVYSFTCRDNDGIDCTVSIITRKKQENRKQLYITYSDHVIVYNIFTM